MPSNDVVTRFAPSPSGELHLGNARTALFNALLARREGGKFLLRVEDTDAERTSEAHVDALIRDLQWLGLPWNEGPDIGGPHAPYRQSARGSIYAASYDALTAAARVYPCFCSANELELSRRAQLAAGRPPRYAGTCRDLTAEQRVARAASGIGPTLRFRVPSGEAIEFVDLVHGPQRFASDDIGDFIVRRADGSAAFFFCNAVDDAAMGVTCVVRGEDHLTNTPRQLLILAALGLPAPRYGHVSLIVGADGAPLSKRHGATSVRELRERGFAPEAVTNHLFRLGHSTPEHGVLDGEAMARAFDEAHLGRAPARFEEEQLRVWQKTVVSAWPPERAAEWLANVVPAEVDADARARFIEAVRPNVVLPADAVEWSHVVFGAAPVLEDSALDMVREAGAEFFAAAAAAAAASPAGNDWKAIVDAARVASGRKGPALFKPLRLALTGLDHGPELAPLLRAMPREQVYERLHRYAAHT